MDRKKSEKHFQWNINTQQEEAKMRIEMKLLLEKVRKDVLKCVCACACARQAWERISWKKAMRSRQVKLAGQNISGRSEHVRSGRPPSVLIARRTNNRASRA